MYFLGDVREKLRLAFDMYDMNKNGKVYKIRKRFFFSIEIFKKSLVDIFEIFHQ